MSLTGLKFHHMGLAVRQDEDALVMLKAMGYEAGEKIFDPLQNVYVRLCTSPRHPTLEIIQPGEGKSPVDALISKYNEIIYHVCYETDDLDKTLADIEAAGLRCLPVAERKPAMLFGGRHVSFYRVVGYGIIELLEPI
jgi:methylmalonyl-CoA/ethylmalonyl-CoA epimerase